MTSLIFALLFLFLALAGIVVRKTYYHLPAHELKRRAAEHDQLAVKLYRAVAYGNSLRGLLWLYIGLTSAASLVLLARVLPIWASLLIIGPLLWIAFSLLPVSRITKPGTRLTILITPAVAWLLNYLHPLLSRGTEAVERQYTPHAHTGLFERADLLALIEEQQHQLDNRLSEEELEITKRALSFGDHIASDITIRRKAIKTVSPNDTIGPVLIDEAHKSGQDYMVVRESPKSAIVGTVAFKDLDIKSNGQVRDIMDGTIYYVHENDALSEVLHAFFVTNHPLFIVINSFEEYVGIITIEGIVRQLVGHVPGDDFDQYTDIAAVAARHPKVKKPKKSATSKADPEETSVKTDDEVIE